MIVTVDTNIVISALINSSGNEFSILFSDDKKVDFVSSYFLIDELYKKVEKIAVFAKSSVKQIKKQLTLITDSFLLIDEKEIDQHSLKEAGHLIRGLDYNDYLPLAVTIFYDALLWIGDLKLYRGLRKKGYFNIVTTKELRKIIKGI